MEIPVFVNNIEMKIFLGFLVVFFLLHLTQIRRILQEIYLNVLELTRVVMASRYFVSFFVDMVLSLSKQKLSTEICKSHHYYFR